MSFFSFGDPLFWIWARFWVARLPDGKKLIGYSDAEFYAGNLKKKTIFWKISNHKKAHPTLKIFGRAISSHIINFRFLPFSRHFQTAEENFFASSRSRIISCSLRKKNLADISRGKDFRADSKKSLFRAQLQKSGSPNEKNDTKAGITRVCHKLRPKFFRQKLVRPDGGASEKVVLTWPLTSWSLGFGPI